jgi:hypothetical protein
VTSQEVSPEHISHLPSATLGSAEDAGGLALRRAYAEIDELRHELKIQKEKYE